MKNEFEMELERIIEYAAIRRVELLHTALKKSTRKKALNLVAGVLALSSSAAIATVLAKVLGGEGLIYFAGFMALVSGTITLLLMSYYSENEIVDRFRGASGYLVLRESVYRLAINNYISPEQKFERFWDLQKEYWSLDAEYSKYFSYDREGRTSFPTPTRWRNKRASELAQEVASNDVKELYNQKLKNNDTP